MPPRNNPLRLNKLQLKTLTLLQELARHPQSASPIDNTGEVMISNLPNPHGDHFHVGERVVLARDATGLRNAAVWVALERKGLARSSFPFAITLTADGLAYETGLGNAILIGGDH
jgi:hypothetical protein